MHFEYRLKATVRYRFGSRVAKYIHERLTTWHIDASMEGILTHAIDITLRQKRGLSSSTLTREERSWLRQVPDDFKPLVETIVSDTDRWIKVKAAFLVARGRYDKEVTIRRCVYDDYCQQLAGSVSRCLRRRRQDLLMASVLAGVLTVAAGVAVYKATHHPKGESDDCPKKT